MEQRGLLCIQDGVIPRTRRLLIGSGSLFGVLVTGFFPNWSTICEVSDALWLWSLSVFCQIQMSALLSILSYVIFVAHIPILIPFSLTFPYLCSTSVVCVMLSIASMSFHSILLCRFFLALSHLFFMLNLSSNAMGSKRKQNLSCCFFFVFCVFFLGGVLSSHEKSCDTILNGKGWSIG